jgi:predicted TIM-barrel fold metal-dependent hydrolase
MISRDAVCGILLALAGTASAQQPLPLFDAHLHYNAEARTSYPVEKALDVFRKNGVTGILASDDEAIEALFSHNPKAKVIWAHTGFGTSPEKLERYLNRYPALWGELSFRYGITDGTGRLTPEFRRLFEKYPDRFLIGSDTWVTERWDGYAQIIAGYRGWLAQLPRDVAERIAYGNAERLFR